MKSTKLFIAAFVTAIIWLSASKAEAQYSEYEVKAAYIFNFAKFIEWPAEYIPGDTIHLCVYKNEDSGLGVWKGSF